MSSAVMALAMAAAGLASTTAGWAGAALSEANTFDGDGTALSYGVGLISEG